MGASGSRVRQRGEDPTAQLKTGSMIRDFDRKAQDRSFGICANLTQMGADYHGIEQSTPLTVIVFEEGIWVTVDE